MEQQLLDLYYENKKLKAEIAYLHKLQSYCQRCHDDIRLGEFLEEKVSNDPPEGRIITGNHRFRFENKAALLTYRGHINKPSYVAWINQKIENNANRITNIRLAHESVNNIWAYPHTHVLIQLDYTFATVVKDYFDYFDNRPHIQAVKLGAIYQAYKYISKEDPDNLDLCYY